MGPRVYYDMTTYDSSIKSLAQFTGISEADIQNYILINEDYSADHFISEFGIDENQLLHNDLWLASLHVTTNNDECASLKTYGLMNLKQTISLDTALGRYLNDCGVQFDLAHRRVHYKGKTFDSFTKPEGLPGVEEDATFFRLFRDPQITSFFSYDNVLTYEGLSERPEFLYNLAVLLNAPSLTSDWDRSSKCYVAKFVAPISHYSDWCFDVDEENDYLEQEDTENKRRRAIIAHTLQNLYVGFFHQTLAENYSFMRPDKIVPFSNMIAVMTREQYLREYGYWDEPDIS